MSSIRVFAGFVGLAVLSSVGFAQTPAAQPAKPLDYVGQLAVDLQPTKKLVYKTVGDRPLHLHLFQPEGWQASDRRPCFLTIHGGGWTGGEPKRMYPFAQHYADLGMVAFSLEYRLYHAKGGISVRHCVEDGRSAVRYLRAHAAELGIDPAKIIVSGGSAGGHVAAGTALFDGVDAADDDVRVSSAANALVLLFPVIDTSKEGYGHAKCGADWQTISPRHRVRKDLPPTLTFHGTGDTVTPFAGAKAFHEAMLAAGNTSKLVIEDKAAHGYLMRTQALYEATLAKSDAFLTTHGFLPVASKDATPEGKGK